MSLPGQVETGSNWFRARQGIKVLPSVTLVSKVSQIVVEARRCFLFAVAVAEFLINLQDGFCL